MRDSTGDEGDYAGTMAKYGTPGPAREAAPSPAITELEALASMMRYSVVGDDFEDIRQLWSDFALKIAAALRAELGRAGTPIGPGHWTIPDDVRGKAFTDWRDANAEWEPDESSYFVAGMEFGIEWALRARADAERREPAP